MLDVVEDEGDEREDRLSGRGDVKRDIKSNLHQRFAKERRTCCLTEVISFLTQRGRTFVFAFLRDYH